MLLRLRFWLHHIDYCVLIAGAAIVIGTLWNYSLLKVPFDLDSLRGLATGVDAISPAALLSLLGGVFLVLMGTVTLWATGAAAVARAEIMVDSSIATVIEINADRKIEELRRVPGARIDFGVVSQLVPANKSKPEPAMIRFVQELLKEAHNLRFDARSGLLQRYRSETNSHVLRLERLQKYTLRLGILGTFVGLMCALASFTAVLSDTSSESSRSAANAQPLVFDAGGRTLVSSLKLSFGTSIAGLAASLFIAAHAELVRRRHLHCFRHIEDASLSLITLAGRTFHREDLLSSLEDNTNAMKTLHGQVYDQTHKLEQALACLDQRITVQTGQIEAGMARLAETREHLDTLLKQLETKHSHFLVELGASLDQLNIRIEESLGNIGKGLSSELRARANQIVAGFDEFLTRVGASHATFIAELTAQFEQASFEKLAQRLPESVVCLGERLAADIGSGFVQVGEQLEGLCDTVAAFERELAGEAHDLTEKASSLQSAIKSIESQVQAAATESIRTMNEVPSALSTIRKKLDGARAGGLFVVDSGIIRKAFLTGFGGFVLGIVFGTTTLHAIAGFLLGPTLLLIFYRRWGAR
jgi:prefoldin subunit 5